MNTKIYIADTTPLFDHGFYTTASKTLPAWRLEKASRYRYTSDRAASAGAFLLLRHALDSNHILIPNPEFSYGKNNKPYLKGHEHIYFNLSHSGKRVMCIIGDSENGCDVQRIEKNGDKIAARFFHEKEVSYLHSIADEETRTRAFYKIWSLKESYLKALGTGLTNSLKSFSVDLDKISIYQNARNFDLSFANQDDLVVKLYDIDHEYIYSASAASLPDSMERYTFI